MGAFEILAAKVKEPGAAITATTPFTGQKLEVKLAQGKTTLQQIWSENEAGGVLRVRSTRLHDDVQGIRLRVPPASPQPLLPFHTFEELFQTDTLIVEESGGGAGKVDVACLLVHYDQIQGSEGNLMTWSEVEPMVEQYMGVEVEPETGAEGEWGKPVALNASMDLFERPYNYAVLGYNVNKAVAAVALSGTQIGPLRHGGPGVINPDITQEWFIRLSMETGEAAIPVFNAQNVGQINVELAGSEVKVARAVTFYCAKLKG